MSALGTFASHRRGDMYNACTMRLLFKNTHLRALNSSMTSNRYRKRQCRYVRGCNSRTVSKRAAEVNQFTIKRIATTADPEVYPTSYFTLYRSREFSSGTRTSITIRSDNIGSRTSRSFVIVDLPLDRSSTRSYLDVGTVRP